MLIDLPDGVQLARFTEQKILECWNKLKAFDKIFHKEPSFERFRSTMLHPKVVVVEAEFGLFIAKEVPGRPWDREVHIPFWDKKLSAHKELCKSLLVWLFFQFELERITAYVAEHSPAIRRFVEKLGFIREGCLRKGMNYRGELMNLYIYSMLRDEVL